MLDEFVANLGTPLNVIEKHERLIKKYYMTSTDFWENSGHPFGTGLNDRREEGSYGLHRYTIDIGKESISCHPSRSVQVLAAAMAVVMSGCGGSGPNILFATYGDATAESPISRKSSTSTR